MDKNNQILNQRQSNNMLCTREIKLEVRDNFWYIWGILYYPQPKKMSFGKPCYLRTITLPLVLIRHYGQRFLQV